MAQKDVGNKIPIYKLKTTDEVMKYYDEWGDKDKYNKDMVDWNYTGPKETAETFNKYEKNKDTFNNNNSRIIYAKKGFFSQLDNQNFLILNEGKILNINQGKTTVINFNRTQLNLSEYSSKTTKYPKLQEVNIFLLSNCLFQPKDQRSTIMLGDNNEFRFQCSHEKKQLDNFSQEFFSRVFKPLYIPLLAIVSAFLLIKSKNSIGYSRFKVKIFVTGVIFISFSEILTKFFSYDFNKSILLMSAPILMSVLLYYFFSKKSLTTSK